ncbi:hypothetical protein ThidrDRAFT_0341 [Thiorhodococcus drewsii AZ1]|uniref:Uncharacterized protein n=1 Tax=Thiorhodococcus drewsii AZ1 TaxID=765913 RepID=G2DWF2_9GAMM|nr:hypothetical protein [Thiorhodococcus drewsii]EGV33652.1 hypothetical protein ThidrDRAFT_0341 [Thiorhodococcus drewsii AZ1]
MATIDNDQDLRAALNQLNPEQQRLLGSRFAERVMHLSRDERTNRAIATGLRADASPGELEDAFKSAKSYAVTTYTDCGKDTDWMAQADHFVAASITAALMPEALMTEKQNRAWKAAVQARMALNCAMMEDDSASEHEEVEQQHRIASEFLN